MCETRERRLPGWAVSRDEDATRESARMLSEGLEHPDRLYAGARGWRLQLYKSVPRPAATFLTFDITTNANVHFPLTCAPPTPPHTHNADEKTLLTSMESISPWRLDTETMYSTPWNESSACDIRAVKGRVTGSAAFSKGRARKDGQGVACLVVSKKNELEKKSK